MATTKGSAIAAPQIFNSDPVEQTYAKGTLDRDMGGIAYAYLNAARGRRDDAQQMYLENLQRSNEMAQTLAREGMANDQLIEALKQAPKYAEAGIAPDLVPALARAYGDPTGDRAQEAALLYRRLLEAKAANELASANKANSAGAEKPPEVIVDTDFTGTGPGNQSIRIKGRNVDAVTRLQEQIARQQFQARGYQGDPNQPMRRYNDREAQQAAKDRARRNTGHRDMD